MIISFIRSLVQELTAAFKPAEWTRLFAQLKGADSKTLRRNLVSLLPQLLIYYVLLSPIVAAPLYNMLLFHPSMIGPFAAHQILGTKIENVFFSAVDGERLHGWYLHCLNSKKVVLINHGNGGNLTNRIPLIAMFLRDGVSVFIYDYEGYGRSSGNPSVKKICQNGNAAFALLMDQMGYRARQIIVFGESLGSGVACDIASKQDVAAIILQSPFASLRNLAREKILWLRLYPNELFPQDLNLENAELLSRPHAPLLIVHGREDRIISMGNAQNIYHSAKPPKTLVLLAHCNHNNLYDLTIYSSAVRRFVESIN